MFLCSTTVFQFSYTAVFGAYTAFIFIRTGMKLSVLMYIVHLRTASCIFRFFTPSWPAAFEHRYHSLNCTVFLPQPMVSEDFVHLTSLLRGENILQQRGDCFKT